MLLSKRRKILWNHPFKYCPIYHFGWSFLDCFLCFATGPQQHAPFLPPRWWLCKLGWVKGLSSTIWLWEPLKWFSSVFAHGCHCFRPFLVLGWWRGHFNDSLAWCFKKFQWKMRAAPNAFTSMGPMGALCLALADALLFHNNLITTNWVESTQRGR